MMLGAFVDSGVPLEVLSETVAALNLDVTLVSSKVLRGGITGTKIDVLSQDSPAHCDDAQSPHAHRHLSKILEIITASNLSASVKQRTCLAFQLLGEAEASIHGVPVEDVHFHEIGAVDTIVDIVCASRASEWLGIEKWCSSALNAGSGTVVCQHGRLPVPAPATLKLLIDAPVYAKGEAMERVTPTGAALLRIFEAEYIPLPTGRVQKIGYGAGSKDISGESNLLRLVVLDTLNEPQEPEVTPIAVIETVIDDASPQLLAYVGELMLKAGAWDVYRTVVQMKKGRSGILLTVLAEPALAPKIREILFRETTTLGVRSRVEEKTILKREFVQVETDFGPVNMKIARWITGEIINAVPEYEDCRLHAEKHQLPLKFIMQAASDAWSQIKDKYE